MSTFENQEYRWRETYFVLFDSGRRPTLEQLEQRLKGLNSRFEMVNVEADENGKFESLTIRSPQDYAAMDISYETGDEVKEQAAMLQQDMKGQVDASERPTLAKMARCDAKFDILHFEQQTDGTSADEDEEGELLDPSALLSVMDVLVEMTGGIAVDPQSGSLL
jgi:hypothetical protein